MKKGISALPVFLAIALGILLLSGVLAASSSIQRISVDSGGNEGNGQSLYGAGSRNGRFVTFESTATNLVPNDTNQKRDVFVHDRKTGVTELVSVDSQGNQSNSDSSHFTANNSISEDGRFVVFRSDATNLAPGGTNGKLQIYVHDRKTGVTELVSVDSEGNQGNDNSRVPGISANGRFVIFLSDATNLVPDDSNNQRDAFVHDRKTGVTELVSVDSDGNQGSADAFPSISGNGRFATFRSEATNLVPGDTNGVGDIFVHDRITGPTERVSVDSHGNQGDKRSEFGFISGNGRFVTFESEATNLVPDDTNETHDVFVHDRKTGVTERVSVDSDGNQADNESRRPTISANGRFVAFLSSATNLVPEGTTGRQIFVHDRNTGVTELVSVGSDGNEANLETNFPTFTGDGCFIVFYSGATNLVENDNNNARDVFIAGNPLAQLSEDGEEEEEDDEDDEHEGCELDEGEDEDEDD